LLTFSKNVFLFFQEASTYSLSEWGVFTP